jgi:tetratricopeptide (TPR) repeat protein
LNSEFRDLEELISQGRYFEARSRAEEKLRTSPHPRASQLLALAISKLGMPELALDTIEQVYRQQPDDPESAGILGSIYKELFKKNQKTSFAVQSRDTYLKNFSVTQSYYTGINAASMSAMAGQASKAREIAAQVITQVEKLPVGFWELATLGEAHLLTKNKPKSIECYVQARKLAGNDWGKVTSAHNQLWLLNHYIPVPNEVLKLFAPPNVVAFSGHMIDHPNRSTPRFPAGIEQQVKDSIRNSIRTLNARIGYCSLACGSDILFVEAMIEEGGEVNLYLPFSQADFIKTSLSFAGSQWVSRFYNIIDNHPINLLSTSGYGGNDELFSFLSRVIYGAAILRSNATHSEPHLLTVSSEIDLKRREGGTRDTVARWPFPQRHVNINPDIYTAKVDKLDTAPAQPVSFEKTNDRILYLVYVGLNGLAPQDFDEIITRYSETTTDSALSIISTQTLEKAKIVGFDTDTGAMEFVDHVKETIRPFKQENSVKFGLHAGTVSVHQDTMTGQTLEYLKEMGTHIGAGSVCASENFASILALNNKSYYLHYAGVIPPSGQVNSPFYNVEFTR